MANDDRAWDRNTAVETDRVGADRIDDGDCGLVRQAIGPTRWITPISIDWIFPVRFGEGRIFDDGQREIDDGRFAIRRSGANRDEVGAGRIANRIEVQL